jgi:signal peptidase
MNDVVSKKEKKNKSKVWSIIENVIIGLIVALIAYIVIEVIIGFVTGKPPCIFGHYIFVVQTGSMNPTIKVGDVVFIKKADFSSINAAYETGDIICFLDINPNDVVYGQYVTHRAVSINENGGIITLGDNNHGLVDAYAVTSSNFLGVVDGVSSFLGTIVSFFTSSSSVIFIFIIIVLLIIAGLEVKNIMMIKEKAKQEEAKEKLKEEILKDINKGKE